MAVYKDIKTENCRKIDVNIVVDHLCVIKPDI